MAIRDTETILVGYIKKYKEQGLQFPREDTRFTSKLLRIFHQESFVLCASKDICFLEM